MPYFDFVWTDEIIKHLAEHGVNREELEEVFGTTLLLGRDCTRPPLVLCL